MGRRRKSEEMSHKDRTRLVREFKRWRKASDMSSHHLIGILAEKYCFSTQFIRTLLIRSGAYTLTGWIKKTEKKEKE